MTTTHDPQRPYGPRHTGRRRALIAAALIAAGVLALACSNPGADDDLTTEQDRANRAAVSASATTAATTAPTTAPATTATTAPTTRATTAAPTKSTTPPIVLTDGVYTIGEDAPAGRYKVAERAGDLCYWSRTRGEDDIIDNGIGGGYPSFTAKQGETVEISSCPEFRRMGSK